MKSNDVVLSAVSPLSFRGNWDWASAVVKGGIAVGTYAGGSSCDSVSEDVLDEAIVKERRQEPSKVRRFTKIKKRKVVVMRHEGMPDREMRLSGMILTFEAAQLV